MRFETHKDYKYFIAVWMPAIGMIMYTVATLSTINRYTSLALILIFLYIGFTRWFKTFYTCNEHALILHTGVREIILKYENIRKISRTKDTFGEVGTGVGLASQGLRLSFNKPVHYGIFKVVEHTFIKVSPKNEALFVEMLLKKNKEIELSADLESSQILSNA